MRATGTGSLTHPVPGAAITSGFGGRVAPTAGATTGHDGIDYGAGYGAAVYGLIPVPLLPHSKYNSARGNYIVINHGNGMQTWYQHLSSMNVTGTDGGKRSGDRKCRYDRNFHRTTSSL